MLRVLHVAESGKGGVPQFVRQVVKGLSDEFQFGIVCPTTSDLYVSPPESGVIHPVEIPHSVSPAGDLLAAFRLARVVSSCGYQIVHLNSSKAGLIGALAKVRLPAKVIFTPHALRSYAYARGAPLWAIAVLAERAICRTVDIVVAVSPDEQKQLIGDGIVPPAKVRLIENGVDLAALATESRLSRDSIGLPRDAFVIGTIGRLSTQKDPLTFAEAAGTLSKKIPTAHFVMVGDGPLEPQVRQRVASMGIPERFHLLGWRSDAIDVLKLFDVFVLTSKYEGMPFVLLEAAGAGKSLVCTAAPGVRSLVAHGENGLLVDIGDWHGLAQAVTCLYEDQNKRARLADRSFESIARPRSLEVMLNQWKDLYQALLGGTSAGMAAPVAKVR